MSEKFYSSRLLNYVEKVWVGGYAKTAFYTEINTNLKPDDRIFILNGNYDSNEFIQQDRYAKYVDGYRVISVHKCKITLDIDYTGQKPYQTDNIENFIKIWNVRSLRDLLYYDSIWVDSYNDRRVSKFEWRLTNNLVFSSNSYNLLGATNSFWARNVNGTWLNANVHFNNNTFGLTGSQSYFASGYNQTNNDRLFIYGEDFTYNNKVFKQRNIYKFQNGEWIIDIKYKPAIISKLNFRDGSFSGNHYDGIWGTYQKSLRWSGDSSNWLSGALINVEWSSGNLNSKSTSGSQSFYASINAKGEVIQTSDFSNNKGYGYNYILDSNIIKSSISNGNFINCNIGSTFSATFSAINDYYDDVDNYNSNIKGGFYNFCDIFVSKFNNASILDSRVYNSNLNDTRMLNSQFFDSIGSGEFNDNNGLKVLSADIYSYIPGLKAGIPEVDVNKIRGVLKLYISHDDLIRLDPYDSFFITKINKGYVINSLTQDQKIILPYETKYILDRFWNSDFSQDLISCSIKNSYDNKFKSYVTATNSNFYNTFETSGITYSSIDLDLGMILAHYYQGGANGTLVASNPTYSVVETTRIINHLNVGNLFKDTVLKNADFDSGIVENTNWNSGALINRQSNIISMLPSGRPSIGKNGNYLDIQISLTQSYFDNAISLDKNIWLDSIYDGPNSTDISGRYQIKNIQITGGSNILTIEPKNGIVVSSLVGDFYFDLESNPNFLSINQVVLRNSKIKSGLFKRSLISNSIFENELFDNSDKDLNPSNIDLLRITKTPFSKNSNIINSGLFYRDHFFGGTWSNGISYETIWKNTTFGSGIFKSGYWKSGTFSSGKFIDSNDTTKSTLSFSTPTEYKNWFDGTFDSGEFENSVWKSGVFNNGKFFSSDWYAGIWNNGILGDPNIPYLSTSMASKILFDTTSGATCTIWQDGLVNNALVGGDGTIYWYGGKFNSGLFTSNGCGDVAIIEFLDNGQYLKISYNQTWIINSNIGSYTLIIPANGYFFGSLEEYYNYVANQITTNYTAFCSEFNISYYQQNYLRVSVKKPTTNIISISFSSVGYVQFSLNKIFYAESIWHDGEFVGAEFAKLARWKNGNFSNGLFSSYYGWDFGNPTSSYLFSWENGNFNGGKFGSANYATNSTWYDGHFNDGIFQGRIWNNGIFNKGRFTGGATWSPRVYESEFVSSFTQSFFGLWKNGTVIDVKNNLPSDNKVYPIRQRLKEYKKNIPLVKFTNSLWLNGTFSSSSGTFDSSIWLAGQFNSGKFSNSVFNPYVDREPFYSGVTSSKSFDRSDNTVWNNGEFLSGNFYFSEWKNGTFQNGTMSGGIWRNGTWNYGDGKNIYWESGRWRNGNWDGSPFVLDNTQNVTPYQNELMVRVAQISSTASIHLINAFTPAQRGPQLLSVIEDPNGNVPIDFWSTFTYSNYAYNYWSPYGLGSTKDHISFKQSVKVATTANLNLSSAHTTIDDFTVSEGDRVLVKNQTNASQNGVYLVDSSNKLSSRAADAFSASQVTTYQIDSFTYHPGYFVEEGTVNGGYTWVQTNDLFPIITASTYSIVNSTITLPSTPVNLNDESPIIFTNVGGISNITTGKIYYAKNISGSTFCLTIDPLVATMSFSGVLSTSISLKVLDDILLGSQDLNFITDGAAIWKNPTYPVTLVLARTIIDVYDNSKSSPNWNRRSKPLFVLAKGATAAIFTEPIGGEGYYYGEVKYTISNIGPRTQTNIRLDVYYGSHSISTPYQTLASSSATYGVLTFTYSPSSAELNQTLSTYDQTFTDTGYKFMIGKMLYIVPLVVSCTSSIQFDIESVSVVKYSSKYDPVYNNKLFNPFGTLNPTFSSTASLPTSIVKQAVSDSGYIVNLKYGNGTFNSGVWENGVWNNGWRSDKTLMRCLLNSNFTNLSFTTQDSNTNSSTTIGSKTVNIENSVVGVDYLEYSGNVFTISLFCIDGINSSYSIGDKVSVGNIVAIDENGKRCFIKDYCIVIDIITQEKEIVLSCNAPTKTVRIETDSQEHIILVSKNIWLSGAFLNGRFNGIWNYGLFQGFPYITLIEDSHWIDGIFDGGTIRGGTSSFTFSVSNNVFPKYYSVPLVQNFEYFDDNNISTPFSYNQNGIKYYENVAQYLSWVDLNYYNYSKTNIGRDSAIFNQDIEYNNYEINLNGYPTKDILSSRSSFRDLTSTNKKIYNLGYKYKTYTKLIPNSELITQFFDPVSNSTTTLPLSGISLASKLIGNFTKYGWTYSSVSTSISSNLSSLTSGVLSLELITTTSNILLNNQNINIENDRYSVIEFELSNFGGATSYIKNDPITNIDVEYPSIYLLNDPRSDVPGSPNHQAINRDIVNHITTDEVIKKEYFYNRKYLGMYLYGNISATFKNISFKEIDMIPFFQYATQSQIDDDIKTPYVAVAPYIEYTNSRFNFIGNITLNLDSFGVYSIPYSSSIGLAPQVDSNFSNISFGGPVSGGGGGGIPNNYTSWSVSKCSNFCAGGINCVNPTIATLYTSIGSNIVNTNTAVYTNTALTNPYIGYFKYSSAIYQSTGSNVIYIGMIGEPC